MTEPTQLKLRVPQHLKEKLEAAASKEHRTVNMEVLKRLEESFSGGATPANHQPAPDMDAITKAVERAIGEHLPDMDAIREAVKEGLKAELDRRFD
ncbi:Arc family DNA-binding protein [Candidatus Thiothrix sp. Deng01]|uniref:Arc family DNA-binding protein n=1 Tax=Candidatus Thiothrix phosphatis TaxID=3112415 RepID=A0ABU6CUT5_9GAMM|nr:Arc family DNA-binding protein [Candidatus Thiothrix sp. Deng01]MEB4590534.1 Arc family DNA-binding protein [Candidatus Thiothrix sp. Deng01]